MSEFSPPTQSDVSGETSSPAQAGSLGPRFHNALSYGVAALIFAAIATILGTHAWLPTLLWIGHFSRRTLESLFVHRYSGRPVPPADYLVEYLYYWGFATWIAWSLSDSNWSLPAAVQTYAAVAIFLLGQLGNGWAHLKLRALRSRRGTTDRAIPRGGLFEWVSCPHYMFEILSWCGFALLTRVWGSYAFLALGTVLVSSYAWTRHRAYRSEFDGLEGRPLYPSRRRAILPLLL
jgi:very-long-chain enoyl-CoA reductase